MYSPSERRSLGWIEKMERLECMTEWKYRNNLRHDPGEKSSFPVSQCSLDGIDVIQSDPTNPAKVNNLDTGFRIFLSYDPPLVIPTMVEGQSVRSYSRP
jgi:hypothetical protein